MAAESGAASESEQLRLEEALSQNMDSDEAPPSDLKDGGASRRAARDAELAAAAAASSSLASGGLRVPAAAGGSVPLERPTSVARASAEPRIVTDVSENAKEVAGSEQTLMYHIEFIGDIPIPELMTFTSWQKWRNDVGRKPYQ